MTPLGPPHGRVPRLRRHPGWLIPCAAAGITSVVLAVLSGVPAGVGAQAPAGSAAASLAFIDAAAGRVEVVRHWPGASLDVTVYPFIPYFWEGCPGPGAIMMLVTAPVSDLPITEQIARGLLRNPPDPSGFEASGEIARIAAALRTPGDPVQEMLKAVIPWVSDLATYERWGYAVFLFVRWQGVGCKVTLMAVPEGYSIPFVR